jgi:hypothetical protein
MCENLKILENQGMQLGRFKNRTPARFEYIYCTLFPLCHFLSIISFYDVHVPGTDAQFLEMNVQN